MLHVAFTPSGAGILRQALRQKLGGAARGGRVIVLDDPLCMGPIDPPDPVRRLAWMTERLGVLPAEWDGLADDTMQFWDVSLAAENPIVWTSRRSAAEYCGFLEWAARRGDAPYRLVDVTETTYVDRTGKARPLISVSQVGPEFLEIETLIVGARFPSTTERLAMSRCWGALRRDGANLRVVSDGQLISAPEDYFDLLLLAGVGNGWVKTFRVVGEAMANTDPMTIPTHSIYFVARMVELVKRGVLEARGDLRDSRRSEVRLAVRKSDFA